MQSNQWISFLFILLAWNPLLKAEVEQVTITWNAFKCQESCVAQIEQNFSAIKEVSGLKINAGLGSAVMKWDPRQPFSYEPFRYAAAGVGIRISTMRVRVKGKITHDAENVFIVSSGDRTNFKLIGPIQTEPGRYTPRYSLNTHPLPPTLREQLLEAEKKGTTVLISGPLLLPSYYSLVLVAEQIKTNP